MEGVFCTKKIHTQSFSNSMSCDNSGWCQWAHCMSIFTNKREKLSL